MSSTSGGATKPPLASKGGSSAPDKRRRTMLIVVAVIVALLLLAVSAGAIVYSASVRSSPSSTTAETPVPALAYGDQVPGYALHADETLKGGQLRSVTYSDKPYALGECKQKCEDLPTCTAFVHYNPDRGEPQCAVYYGAARGDPTVTVQKGPPQSYNLYARAPDGDDAGGVKSPSYTKSFVTKSRDLYAKSAFGKSVKALGRSVVGYIEKFLGVDLGEERNAFADAAYERGYALWFPNAPFAEKPLDATEKQLFLRQLREENPKVSAIIARAEQRRDELLLPLAQEWRKTQGVEPTWFYKPWEDWYYDPDDPNALAIFSAQDYVRTRGAPQSGGGAASGSDASDTGDTTFVDTVAAREQERSLRTFSAWPDYLRKKPAWATKAQWMDGIVNYVTGGRVSKYDNPWLPWFDGRKSEEWKALLADRDEMDVTLFAALQKFIKERVCGSYERRIETANVYDCKTATFK